MKKINNEQINKILEKGVSEIIEKNHLELALKSGKPLRVKFGIDPTSPDLHLGHAVPLRKLRQFQDAGHKIILVIGDFTAQIGDPSGRTVERKPLSKKEVKKNLKNYLNLAGKIININQSEVKFNSEWLDQNLDVLMEIARAGSIQQLLRRADFKKRLSAGDDVTLLEMFYPLFQGYDSVNVRANVEIGGADQKFNLLMGRRVQRHFKITEQDIVTVPLLEGTDGKRKMSKSYGNYIALDEEPNEMFVKIMTIPDNLIEKYFLLLTDLSQENIKSIREKLSPKDQKKKLASEIVLFLHSSKAAKIAEDNFEQIYSNKNIPSGDDLKVFRVKSGEEWGVFLVEKEFVKSKSEAKRLVEGGGINLDGIKVSNTHNKIETDGIAKIGKHKFIKIEIQN